MLEPGCFGSALLYRVNAPECEACTVATSCASRVAVRQQEALRTVALLDGRFETERTRAVERWWSGRWKRDKVTERNKARAQETLDRWKRERVNVYELRHRMNPAPATAGALHTAFAFVATESAFKPRDLAEHLRENHADMNKSAAERYSSMVCEALLEAGVLLKENRGVLCLN